MATGTMAAGSYSGTITLSATGTASVTIPVALTITAAPVPPAIGVSPTSLSFTARQEGSDPTAQTLTINNTGGGTLSWGVSHDATWLVHTPGTGTGAGTVTISVTTGTLTAGTYNGVVTLWPTGASSVTVPVTFTVTAAPAINLSPSSLSYAATQGAANPANQNIALTNSGGTFNWTVSDDASWLAVSPASGSGSSTLTTSVNTAGLTAGTYTGTLTASAAGASSKTVAVTLTVSAPATSSATLTWNANTDSDLAGYKIYRATTSGGYGATIATVPGNITTYIAAGLQSGTTYFFVITAYDSTGNESPFSNEVSKSIF
ncbi:MAG: fibronectin type III domain-containing protein [Nitrospiraceae bacterium]|nr:fibronectin type III domain-containing protein [Nitrospiraceae bacterium]